MISNKAFKTALILILFTSLFACSKKQSAEEQEQEKEELEVVDKTLKSDQEKADSMKKALGIDD